MKRTVVRAAFCLLAICALVWAGTASAGRGGPNGTFVHFQNGGDCHTYWLMTGSGLVHEWRYGDPSCACVGVKCALHLVFKPMSKFESADCDAEGYLTSFPWTFNYAAYTDMPNDEGDLTDFLTPDAQYWVCIYDWTE